jgi:hypothetical protein
MRMKLMAPAAVCISKLEGMGERDDAYGELDAR